MKVWGRIWGMGVWRPQCLTIWAIYYRYLNNAFLGMFQLKFYLKTFETY